MTITLGTPVIHGDMSNPDKTGFIAVINKLENKTFTIGAQGLVQDHLEYVIAWKDKTFTQISDSIAEDWIDRAKSYDVASVTPEKALEMLEAAKTATTEKRTRDEAKRKHHEETVDAFRDQIRDKVPSHAKAVIIAELKVDDCDSMSDYFGSSVSKTIILGFSTHTRDLFPEMRKAARNHEKTAHLADGPKDWEHREKYSMGGGYYLKDGWRHRDGWSISKQTFYSRGNDVAKNIPFGEWAVPEITDIPAANTQAAGSFEIEEHTHTKKGFQMFICTMSDRVERDEYMNLLQQAKALGGWYTRKWGSTPAGFAFKSLKAAQQFAGGTKPTSPKGPKTNTADKLRTLADKMQGDIDHKLGDRLTNTPKRQREAASARHEGERLQRTQQGLNALADLHEVGNVPTILAKVITKKAAYDLAQSKIDRSNAAYYDAGIDTGEPFRNDPLELAFWSLLTPKSEAEKTADTLRDMETKVSRSKIDGYFPTPPPVIEMMLDRADIQEGDKILEPSAGSGAIMDAVKATYPNNDLWGYEVNNSLLEILRLKGHLVTDGNFLCSCPVMKIHDKILMNPPFEKGQDMDHVRHAYDNQLKKGGRLVAIMSPSFTFNSNRKATEFREWLEGLNYWTTDISAGAFKESGTNVSTVLLVVEK